MKPLLTLALFTLVCLVPLGTHAQEPKKPDPFVKKDAPPPPPAKAAAPEKTKQQNLLFVCECLDAPLAKYHAWLLANPKSNDLTLRQEAAKWIAANEAQVLETSLIASLSGQRSQVQSVREVSYPIEFDSSLKTILLPTAFETRNVGHSFELEAVAAGEKVDVSTAPEWISEAKALPPPPSVPGAVQEKGLGLPVFRTLRPTLATSLVLGGCKLLGSAPSPEDPARVRLMFLRDDESTFEDSTTAKAAVKSEMQLRFEYIEVPHTLVTTSLNTEPLRPLAEGLLREKALAIVSGGTAKVVSVMVTTARSGQRTRLDSGDEHMYPTEFSRMSPDGTAGIHPRAFVQRNVGLTVECDPVISQSGEAVSLSFSSETVALVGESVHLPRRADDPQGQSVATPIFHTQRLMAQVNLSPGKPLLVGITTPPGPDGQPAADRKVLLFVTAEL